MEKDRETNPSDTPKDTKVSSENGDPSQVTTTPAEPAETPVDGKPVTDTPTMADEPATTEPAVIEEPTAQPPASSDEPAAAEPVTTDESTKGEPALEDPAAPEPTVIPAASVPAAAAAKPPRNWKRLAMNTVLVVVAFVLATLVFKAIMKPKSSLAATSKRPTSSPLSYINGFDGIKSGRMHLVTNNLGGAPDLNGDYDFFVTDDGRVLIDLMPEVGKANGFIDTLYKKETGTSPYPASITHATRYVELDLQTILGYDSFRSTYPLALFNAFTPYFADYGKYADVTKANESGLLNSKPSDACSAAAKTALDNISANHFNTNLLKPEVKVRQGNRVGFVMNTKGLDEVEAKAQAFIKACWIDPSKNKTADQKYIDDNIFASIHKARTHYKFVVETKPQKRVQIFADSADASKDKPLYEMTVIKDKATGEAPADTTAHSLYERPNLFAYTYATCRNAPVELVDFTHSYHFISGEDDYRPPSSFESAYLCSTTDERVKGYSHADAVQIHQGGGTITMGQTAISEQAKLHELSYRVEQYYLKNGNYPSLKTIMDGKVSGINPAKLVDLNGKKLGEGDFTYAPTPANCDQCKGYTITYKYYYAPTNNTVEMTKSDYQSVKSS